MKEETQNLYHETKKKKQGDTFVHVFNFELLFNRKNLIS